LDSEEGITVYRSLESRGKIFTFRGTSTIDTSIPKLLALMSDSSRLPEWVFNCKGGELVERNFTESDRRPNPDEYYQIFYGIASVPWPLQSRDYVLKATTSYEHDPTSKKTFVKILMRSIDHPKKPASSDFVRMPLMESVIILSPQGEHSERTLVDFSVTTDPGGNIPTWISKLASREIPSKTLMALRKLSTTQEYNKEFEKFVSFYAEKRFQRDPK
jgi:hypothetical protein